MWELIPGGDVASATVESHRLKVPGGWIVRTVAARYEAGVHTSQTFVDDPFHSWMLVSELENPTEDIDG